MAVHSKRVDINGTNLWTWIQSHWAATRTLGIPFVQIALPPDEASSTHYKAVARASNGDTFALASGLTAKRTGGKTNHDLSVILPGRGVPAAYQWLDITVSDTKNRRETWRIFDFPRLTHAVLPNTPLHQTQTVQNVSLSARAWWDANAAPSGSSAGQEVIPVVTEIKAVVPASALARPSQSWGVQIVSVMQEWEDPERFPLVKGGSGGFSNGSSEHVSFGAGTSHAEARSDVAPCPSAQHIVQIDARLTEYDAMEETVTFQNVPLEPDGQGLRVAAPPPGGLILTTPSGVRVALQKPLPLRRFLDDPARPNEVRVAFEVNHHAVLLPQSPLQKRIGLRKPILLGASVLFDGDALSTMQFGPEPGGGGTDFARMEFKQRLPRPVLPFLTVHVTQTAELQRVPVSFMVPVRAGKPQNGWGGN